MSEKVTLKPENIKALIDRLGSDDGELRESEAREQYLDKLARIICDVKTNTKLGSNAYSKHVENDEYYIEIPQTKTQQPITNMDEDVWDLLFQETVLFHEIGHVLYSDFTSFKSKLSNNKFGNLFKLTFNALEDGCIEQFLAEEFNIEKDLKIMNANLVKNVRENKKNKNGVEEYTAYEAIHAGLMDHGFYNSGRWEDIVSGNVKVQHHESVKEFEDRIKKDMKKALTTTSGHTRVKIAYELAEDMYDEFCENPNKSGNINPSPDSRPGSEMGDGGQNKNPQTPNQKDIEEKMENSSPEDVEEIKGNVEEMIEENYKQEVNQQEKKQKQIDQEIDPLNEQLETMASGDSMGDKITIPDWNMNNECMADSIDAKRKGQSLAQILNAQLQRERKSRIRYGVDEGALNTTELHRLSVGAKDIFKNRERPGAKSYSVVIILDRSNSMKKPLRDYNTTEERLRGAQKAVGQLVYALYEVGVDVTVLSFYKKDTHIEVPFGADPSEYDDILFSSNRGGGTPLSDTLEFAESQLENGKYKENFIITITDGKPKNTTEYKDVLDSLDIPVFGVYVNEDKDTHGRHSKYFDCVRYATPDTVDQKCRELCKNLIV